MADFDPWAALAAAQSTLANSSSALATPSEVVSEANTSTCKNSSSSCNSSRAEREVSQASGEICKERKKQDIYILQRLTTDEPPLLHPGEPASINAQDTPPARVAILREFSLSDGNESDNDAFRAARVNRPEITVPGPSDILRAPLEWRHGFSRLNRDEAPCPGFRLSMEWRDTYAALHAFLEQHAETAHALGWDTLDLFAVHRTVGGSRVDCVGAALLMAGSLVRSIDRDVIALDRAQDGQPCGRIFRTPHKHEMVPVWEFGQ